MEGVGAPFPHASLRPDQAPACGDFPRILVLENRTAVRAAETRNPSRIGRRPMAVDSCHRLIRGECAGPIQSELIPRAAWVKAPAER